MKGVLSPQPTSLLLEICFFLVKKTIRSAVWVIVALEIALVRRLSNKRPERSWEPNYPRYFLSSLLTGDDRIVMLGDLSQHYERLFNDFGETEANKWLQEEVAESALHLILRREFVKHVFRSIRNLCGYALRRTAGSTKPSDGHLAAVNRSFGVRPFAFLSLLAMALASMFVLLHEPSRVVKKVDPSTGKPDDVRVALNVHEIAAGQRSVEPSRPARTRHDIVRNPVSVVSNIPPTEVSLVMLDSVPRTDAQNKVPSKGQSPPSVTRKRHRFSMPLPPGSRSGSYEVILQDSTGKTLASSNAKSTDGKSLSVTFDLERLPANEYRISVSQKKDEVPSFYPFRVKVNE